MATKRIQISEIVTKHFTLKIIFLIVGVIAGYFYWYFYACTEGCAITSSWYGSMAAGGIFGYLIGGILEDVKSKNKDDEK